MKAEEAADKQRLGSGRMFDAIAGRYDLLNRILSFGIDRGWRRAAVAAARLDLAARPRVLDVATGTADLAIELATSAETVEVVGVDPSPAMLEVGARKIRERGLEARARLLSGQAESLPFSDGSFDAVTIAFGIRNVEDRPKGLCEMRRVTKPGGRVVVLELSEPKSSLAKVHVHHVVPLLGGLISGRREYGYLQASIAAFPPPEAFCRMMTDAGLANVTATALTMGVAHLFVGEVPGS